MSEDAAYMRFKCVKGFKEKFANLPKEEFKTYWDRVKYELTILEQNNFSSYLLVSADFILWAKRNNILVGPGRGSVGGSFGGVFVGNS